VYARLLAFASDPGGEPLLEFHVPSVDLDPKIRLIVSFNVLIWGHSRLARVFHFAANPIAVFQQPCDRVDLELAADRVQERNNLVREGLNCTTVQSSSLHG
jgi:hypothetical protein